MGEASSAEEQAGLEAKRLGSEEQLANLTLHEKQAQLQDAAAIAGFASSEFVSEQQQAASTVNATKKVLALAEHGHRESSASSKKLLQNLKQLKSGMESEQQAAHEEQSRMVSGFYSFAERLGSTMMEAESQAAAFKAEAAEREREQLRLLASLSHLSTLLQAAKHASVVTSSACGDLGNRGQDVVKFLVAETNAVATLLQQQTQQAQQQQPLDMGAVPSLLQTASSGPAGPAAAENGEEELVKADADNALEQATDETGASNALQDIQQFALASGGAAAGGEEDFGAEAPPPKAAQEQEEKEAAALAKAKDGEEQQQREQQQRCASFLQEAKRDVAALTRSLGRAQARLSANEATMALMQQESAFMSGEDVQLKEELGELAELSQNVLAWVNGLRQVLKGHAEQVMVLSTDMGEQCSEGPGACQAVRDLAQRLGSHQSLLEQYGGKFQLVQGSVGSASQEVRAHLQETQQATKQRLARLQAEHRLLAALVRAKANAQAQSVRFQQGAGNLCK